MKKKIILFFKDLWSLKSFKVVLTLSIILAFYFFRFYDDSIDPIYNNILAGIFSGLIITVFHVFVDFETLQLNSKYSDPYRQS